MKELSLKLSLVPTNPGCYLMKDKNGTIIYVGKAKNLKKRVSSYFNKIHTGKTASLVSNINSFDYIITNTEVESLILEINLIKKYNPKYNILLKDDKTYPFIELTFEKYPKLKIIRSKKRRKTKNKLYGPYPNVTSARKTVELINRIYPLRKCNNIGNNLCLYYHIGECLGYCKINVPKEQIDIMLKEINNILNGDYKFLTLRLEKEMKVASDSLNYEKANEIKQEINDIKITLSKQIIVSNIKYDFDVFGYFIKDNFLVINTLIVRKGIVIGSYHEIFTENFDNSDLFIRYIVNFYEKFSLPKEIIVPSIIDVEVLNNYLNIPCAIPKKGDIKRILDMSCLNAKIALLENIETIKKDSDIKNDIKEELKELLNINSVDRIELFDNSHLFGTYYVGAMVVYTDLKKDLKEYRKYKIDVSVKDDLKAMQEVIYRRYYKVLLEKLKKPDLIIIDGGIPQVKVVKKIIEDLNLNIKVIGLAKDNKHKTNVIINDNLESIPLPKDNKLFLYLTKMQDEVHRFVINYHRDLRSKGSISSVLDNVPGIGEKRKKILLKNYNSINKIKEESLSNLEKLIPIEVAKNLLDYLNNLDKKKNR